MQVAAWPRVGVAVFNSVLEGAAKRRSGFLSTEQCDILIQKADRDYPCHAGLSSHMLYSQALGVDSEAGLHLRTTDIRHHLAASE